MTASYDWARLFLSPKGRINRFDFNIRFGLVYALVMVLAVIADMAVYGAQALRDQTATPNITLVTFLIVFWPFGVAAVKRLHDIGHSGWYFLFLLIVPIVLGFAGMMYFAQHGSALGFNAVKMLVNFANIAFCVVLAFARGTTGPNRFGPAPYSTVTSQNLEGTTP